MAWYHTFFNGMPQRAWKAAQTPEQTQLDLELIVEILDIGPGDRLLDVFCGYGRHALPLAQMGARVTGVDISEEYITELTQAAKKTKLSVKSVEGDFLTLPVADIGKLQSFDAGYCLGNSFSFFPRADLRAFLERVAGLLKPGGRFLVHSEMVAESVLPDYQARNWQPVETDNGESILFLVDNTYLPLEGRIDSQLTYVQAGEVYTRLAQHYVYTLAELVSLFVETGWRVEACYGTPAGDAYELGDEALWLAAVRQ